MAIHRQIQNSRQAYSSRPKLWIERVGLCIPPSLRQGKQRVLIVTVDKGGYHSFNDEEFSYRWCSNRGISTHMHM